MRIAFSIALGTALVATALVGGGLAAAQPARPALQVLDRTPLVARGTGFAPRERVIVTASTELAHVLQSIRATARGSFTVRFEALRLTPCTGATLVATGARGHTARLKLGLRECPGPALDP